MLRGHSTANRLAFYYLSCFLANVKKWQKRENSLLSHFSAHLLITLGPEFWISWTFKLYKIANWFANSGCNSLQILDFHGWKNWNIIRKSSERMKNWYNDGMHFKWKIKLCRTYKNCPFSSENSRLKSNIYHAILATHITENLMIFLVILKISRFSSFMENY